MIAAGISCANSSSGITLAAKARTAATVQKSKRKQWSVNQDSTAREKGREEVGTFVVFHGVLDVVQSP